MVEHGSTNCSRSIKKSPARDAGDRVRGRVQRVYGEGSALRIVVALDPEESEWIVDEPTTVAVLADEVRLAPPAA